ncbi:mechanosensitive ion channel family protein [Lewinella sp. W8]|uniref:mechanosensitive ion channel family protein n=1 Tax=Lewinella sp. W8 TaxID=2528208 RepID=UPI0010680FBA|nr:mechanosensitive ion channel domain-containing protein [Lewinella sp. W8]MTB51248.1 mechanosensitive ion channel [Lewinella sp. W8]
MLEENLLNLNNFTLNLKGLLTLIPALFVAIFLYRRFLGKLRRSETTREDVGKIGRVGVIWIILVVAIAVLASLDLNPTLVNYSWGGTTRTLTLLLLLEICGIVGAAILLDWIIESYLKLSMKNSDDDSGPAPKEISRVVRPVIYLLTALILTKLLGVDFSLWNQGVTSEAPAFNLQFSGLLFGLLVLSIVRAGVWLVTKQILPRYYRRKEIALGVRFAINRLFSYFIYLFSFLLILENAGFDLVGLWTGAAALLVGIGIGLQQTFNDLISGIILLFERSVEVGDMVEVNGLVGRVQKISTRTSLIKTRDNITIIVPNSKIVGENAINWSHHDNKARFFVEVGVAYGSPTKQVREILLGVAAAHGRILKHPAPFTRFNDFGASSLDFRLYFFTNYYEVVEDTKSDLRYEIDEAFRQYDIQIPFPQRDLWIKNPETLQPTASPAG